MPTDLNLLSSALKDVFGEQVVSLENKLGELTLIVHARDMQSVLKHLRDDARFGFEQYILQFRCGLIRCTPLSTEARP